LIPR